MLDDVLKKLYDSLFHESEYELTEDEIDEMDTESRIIRTATEDEMDIVKKDRKSKSKMNKPVTKKEPKSKNKVEFKDGDIIQSEAFFDTKFLIIGFYDNIIITVELDYFMKGKLLIREFYDNDKRLHLIKYNTHEEEAVFNNNQGYFLALFDEICDQKDKEDSKGPRLTMKIDA